MGFYGNIMNKNFKIFGCTRNSMLGDIIVSLPFLNYLEKVYPNSYKCAYIDKKCGQIAPFLINHSLIDKIQVSDESDKITQKDIDFINGFDLKFHPFPQHPGEHDWFNKRNIIEETFRMNFLIGQGYINPNEYEKLTEEEKKPRLYQWFNTKRENKTIALWCESGYANQDETINQRSPSFEFWSKLVDILVKDYKVIQLGHPNSKLLENKKIIDLRNLSLFDAVKISLGCDLVIGTDSGSQWIIGAYGHPQICLYTNYKKDHIQNKKAFLPVNYKNNLVDIYGKDGNINNIEVEEVLEKVKIINE